MKNIFGMFSYGLGIRNVSELKVEARSFVISVIKVAVGCRKAFFTSSFIDYQLTTSFFQSQITEVLNFGMNSYILSKPQIYVEIKIFAKLNSNAITISSINV